MTYTLPDSTVRPQEPERTAYLVASGDLRHAANVAGWQTQQCLRTSTGGCIAAVRHACG